MFQRIVTAVVLIPLVVGGIFYLPPTAFALVAALLTLLAAWEWSPLMGDDTRQGRVRFTGVVAVLLLVLSGFLLPAGDLWQHPLSHTVTLAILILSVAWWILSLVLVVGYPRNSGFWRNSQVFKWAAGLLMLLPTYLAMLMLRAAPGGDTQGAWLLLLVMVLVWSADSGAYLFGKQFGRTKLMPKVSPNKTIEGLLGGMLVSSVFILAGIWWLDIGELERVPFVFCGMLAVLISVLGDLNESMFKREAGIKDSGNILPGHGGVLDRIDSLTAAMPLFALCYALMIEQGIL